MQKVLLAQKVGILHKKSVADAKLDHAVAAATTTIYKLNAKEFIMAIEDIKDLAERVPSLQPMLDDEAKTKQFLVLPLIRALGYDDANPAEVVPEYTADFGTRQVGRPTTL